MIIHVPNPEAVLDPPLSVGITFVVKLNEFCKLWRVCHSKSTLSTLDFGERNLPDANEAAENFEERIIIYT